MEIKVIKDRQKVLESKILKLIKDFEAETEMEIGRINMSRTRDVLGETRKITVQAEISI